jgi:hypothetical protein
MPCQPIEGILNCLSITIRLFAPFPQYRYADGALHRDDRHDHHQRAKSELKATSPLVSRLSGCRLFGHVDILAERDDTGVGTTGDYPPPHLPLPTFAPGTKVNHSGCVSDG